MAVTPQVASDYGWQISLHTPRITFEDKCVTATVSVSRDSSWIGLLAPRKAVQPQLPAVSSSSSSTNWAAVRCGQLSGEECVAQTLFAASLEWKWAEIHHSFQQRLLGDSLGYNDSVIFCALLQKHELFQYLLEPCDQILMCFGGWNVLANDNSSHWSPLRMLRYG